MGDEIVVSNLVINMVSRGMNQTTSAMNGLRRATDTATKHTNKLVSSLKRIAMYRLLRTIIKEIGQAFSEGLKNAYAFSQTINGQLSQALDSIASHGMQMKNQLGSALGELLMNLQPMIEGLANLITRVADALARLFAVLGGRSTYNKATTSAEKWAKATKTGAKAAKEWKNQLLGFDEINKLEEPSDSGRGSGSYDSIGAWEEAPAQMKWAEELKRITMDWWNSLNFEPIIEAWGKLKEAVGGFVSLVDSGLKWAYENVLLPLFGWLIEAGLPAAMNALADAISYVTEKISGLVQKAKDAKTFGEFLKSLDGDEVTLFSIATAIGAVITACMGFKLVTSVVNLATTAFGLLSSPIGIAITIITALVAVGITLYKNWDTIKEKATKLGESIKNFFTGIKTTFENVVHKIGDPIVEVFDTIISKVREAWDFITGFFSFLGAGEANMAAAQADGSIYLQGFASGGYPDEGQLFMAREAGPELVGTIGGRTAVASNNDIVTALTNGVYEGVSAAMGGNSQTVNVRVFLDSKEIKAGQQRLARATGGA